MSTDIGALQKQYKTLQQKQHHACVVLSDIGQPAPQTPPNSPVETGDDSFINNNMAVMTLSVNTDSETIVLDSLDAVSPMAFGKTKCIFVQNNSKKCKKKRKASTDKVRHNSSIMEEEITNTAADNSTTNEKEMHAEHLDGEENDKILENPEVQTTDTKEELNVVQADDSANKKIDGKDNQEALTYRCPKCEIAKKETDNSFTDNETESRTSELQKEVQEELCETKNANKLELSITRETDASETKIDVKDLPTASAHEVKIENSVLAKTEPEMSARELYKPYYPLKVKPRNRRHNSTEKMVNKQSIYQHFTMTKRQLSLDSALGEGNDRNPTSSVEFPFPVHSINQHKIQTGMKLGLYDQKALEKLETMKPRKNSRKRLPSLNVE